MIRNKRFASMNFSLIKTPLLLFATSKDISINFSSKLRRFQFIYFPLPAKQWSLLASVKIKTSAQMKRAKPPLCRWERKKRKKSQWFPMMKVGRNIDNQTLAAPHQSNWLAKLSPDGALIRYTATLVHPRLILTTSFYFFSFSTRQQERTFYLD